MLSQTITYLLLLTYTTTLLADPTINGIKPDLIVPQNDEILETLLAYSFNEYSNTAKVKTNVQNFPKHYKNKLAIIKFMGFTEASIKSMPANTFRRNYLCETTQQFQLYVTKVDEILSKYPHLINKHIGMKDAVPEANANLSAVNEEIRKLLPQCELNNDFDPIFYLKKRRFHSNIEEQVLKDDKKRREALRNKQFEDQRKLERQSTDAIAAMAKNDPNKMVNCLVKWTDSGGSHQENGLAKASDHFGFACLAFCLETLKKNGVKKPSHNDSQNSECFSDGHSQGYPH